MFSLADTILEEKVDTVKNILEHDIDVNGIDEYGFTPLIEAAIINNLEISKMLVHHGANPNQPDMLGNTALHWAAENNNHEIALLLLKNHADPNASNIAGQPILAMPLLRQQQRLKKLLLQHGADLVFAQDYINTKFLGHLFELVGSATIVNPQNQFVEVDFEGFFLEISLGMIADSLDQFKNHFAGRQLRRYIHEFQIVIDVVFRASHLMKYQQYKVNIQKHQSEILSLIQEEPLIIPIGYEGHAITFIKFGNILVKCDRREDSRLYDNIMIYQMNNPSVLSVQFIQKLMYEKQSDDFINHRLPELLELQPITELKMSAQISGNCSWANVEACVPALFFLLFSRNEDFSSNIKRYKSLSLKLFNEWREWNKERALQFCIQNFKQADSIRKACKAEILTAILYQCCGGVSPLDSERAELILNAIAIPEYEPILKNYIQVYCYEDYSEEGKRFLQLLREWGYKI